MSAGPAAITADFSFGTPLASNASNMCEYGGVIVAESPGDASECRGKKRPSVVAAARCIYRAKGPELVRAPAKVSDLGANNMARPIWKGHISFGLVNVPVVLYSAERRATSVSA